MPEPPPPLSDVLAALYASEINCGLESFWDGGFRVWIGDPLNGALFDFFGGYRPLFLMMAAYTALAFVVVLLVPRGAGEADL